MSHDNHGRNKTEKIVLVVDDEGGVRRVVSRLCKLVGVEEVLTAVSVREAIAVLGANHVDLIISDYNMPDATGLEIVRAVRLEKKHIPVIVFTGSADKAQQRRVAEAGADVVLCKISDLSDLEDAVRKMLDLGIGDRLE
ncbi:MAG: response regulator [bacterium]